MNFSLKSRKLVPKYWWRGNGTSTKNAFYMCKIPLQFTTIVYILFTYNIKTQETKVCCVTKRKEKLKMGKMLLRNTAHKVCFSHGKNIPSLIHKPGRVISGKSRNHCLANKNYFEFMLLFFFFLCSLNVLVPHERRLDSPQTWAKKNRCRQTEQESHCQHIWQDWHNLFFR